MDDTSGMFWTALPVFLPVLLTLIGGFSVLIWRIGVIHTEFRHLQEKMEAQEERVDKHEAECAERMRRVYIKLDDLGRGMATIEGLIDAYGRVRSTGDKTK